MLGFGSHVPHYITTLKLHYSTACFFLFRSNVRTIPRGPMRHYEFLERRIKTFVSFASAGNPAAAKARTLGKVCGKLRTSALSFGDLWFHCNLSHNLWWKCDILGRSRGADAIQKTSLRVAIDKNRITLGYVKHSANLQWKL